MQGRGLLPLNFFGVFEGGLHFAVLGDGQCGNVVHSDEAIFCVFAADCRPGEG